MYGSTDICLLVWTYFIDDLGNTKIILIRKGLIYMDMNQIIERWQNEYDNSTDACIRMIGQTAIYYMKEHPEEAGKITDDLTLKGCMDFMRERARKNQKNNVGVATMEDLYDYFHFGGRIVQPLLSAQDVERCMPGQIVHPETHHEPKRVTLDIDDLL